MTGIICVDKQENMTSFSAVARARRITGEKKAGHAGTLDPMATGVLPVLFGGATRFMEFLPVQDKGYRAHIRLGLTTDTLDTTGTVLTRSEPHVTREQLEQALCGFRGAILQVPPMYSALSKNGVRLYELARRGEEVERPDDIGRALGCGAAMSALRRSYAAGFFLEDCVTLDALAAFRQDGALSQCIIPLERALGTYPSLTVTEAQAVRFANGGALDAGRLRFAKRQSGFYRVYSPDQNFLGLGELPVQGDELKVRRVLQDT